MKFISTIVVILVFLSSAAYAVDIRYGYGYGSGSGTYQFSNFWERGKYSKYTPVSVDDIRIRQNYNSADRYVRPSSINSSNGLNSNKNYVQSPENEPHLQYGHNPHGEQTFRQIGGRRVHYGYNSAGKFVPVGVEY